MLQTIKLKQFLLLAVAFIMSGPCVAQAANTELAFVTNDNAIVANPQKSTETPDRLPEINADDPEISVERWMVDSAYWVTWEEASEILNELAQEEDVVVLKAMKDGAYFESPTDWEAINANLEQSDEEIKVERWMKDDAYWNLPTTEAQLLELVETTDEEIDIRPLIK